LFESRDAIRAVKIRGRGLASLEKKFPVDSGPDFCYKDGATPVKTITIVIPFLICSPLGAALSGNNFQISGPGCRFPDVAYSSASRNYLVVWADYNVTRIFGRLVTDAGLPVGGAVPITEAPYGGLFPAVAYNATNDEFLVTWDDFGRRGDVIHGQRVRASDGALVSTNFPIGSVGGGIRSALAWSPVNNSFLVVYWVPAGTIEVYGQRVSASGTLLGANFNISNDGPFSGYPAIAWGASGNQFLVTWDHDDGNIRGQRIAAANGAPLGSVINVTTGGAKDRSCIAYDSVNLRWLVQFNNGANAGFSYDQYGQLINSDGSLSGAALPIAHTPSFEGDTQFGGDVAFVPKPRRFLSSFGTDTGMGAQESFANGSPVGAQVVLGTGYYTSLNNAADPQRNRFLTAWEGLAGNTFYIFGQLYGATLNPVTNFSAAAQTFANALSWRNPSDVHFTGTMIRYRTDGYPAGPSDGALVVDQPGAPGSTISFAHTNLTNWVTYYYAAFARDDGPNYSTAMQAAATPRPPVTVVATSDFTTGNDGWTMAAWQSGSLAPGTIVLDAGTVLSTGSGVSNNRDACTREGSMMTRLVSAAGHHGIQVEYDVFAALHAPPGGTASAGCTVLESTMEDKLVIYYSTAGTNGPWTAAQTLSEGVELPTGWTRRLINLAGVSAVNDNPNFALRFQWQFNTASDTGRVDNIRILSGAVTAPVPVIGVSASVIERTVQAGQSLPNDVLRIRNTGEGTLNFNVMKSASWLSVSPVNGSSPGPERTLSLAYNAISLPVGDHEGVVQIVSANALNSPQSVRIKVHVISAVCFWEPFAYYDGNLTTMGSANWAGPATNQLVVEGKGLKIIGGGGLVSAAHALSCAGSNRLIAAQTKIRRGAGSGDFFWNIALDDAAGNNLARWYGGSTIARGRIGNSITADMSLSGESVWDDLYILIDTVSNVSEFFFNGVSFRAISHGATPGDSVGSIRLERLDRLNAANDAIYFDDLTIGPPDNSVPRLLIRRSTSTLSLSWRAAGLGATLQSAFSLDSPGSWTLVTSGITFANGENHFTTAATNPAAFFRLARP
jgi:hypothetical protein